MRRAFSYCTSRPQCGSGLGCVVLASTVLWVLVALAVAVIAWTGVIRWRPRLLDPAWVPCCCWPSTRTGIARTLIAVVVVRCTMIGVVATR